MKRFLLVAVCILIVCEIYGQEKITVKANASIPAGYENVAWGTKLSDARNRVRGKLVFTDEKTLILSREEGIDNLDYYYGFFYIDPAKDITAGKKTAEKEAVKTEGQEKADEGKLFYVDIKFPYLVMEDVQKTIEKKYGTFTDKKITDNQGAIIWNGDSTIIVMWIDRYENKPYCRRITYVDKKVTKELSDYQYRIFNKVEIAVLNQLGM
jgi:hypothetical protein